mgnify:CR=1 FL=1
MSNPDRFATPGGVNRNAVIIGSVVALHVAALWALQSGLLRRAVELAQEEGQLSRESDAHQIAFEIHGLILALHYEARFLRAPDSLQRAVTAFEGIVQRYSAGGATDPAPARKAARKPRAA